MLIINFLLFKYNKNKLKQCHKSIDFKLWKIYT
jgi:hypothetical protein